ncbi:hypothetical protein [Candidatus Magnetominusculus xianensis]|uniref:Dihydroorotate dehydrogenase n=1 Tax=Candidatus Magnetominusculus xianensis TaxID=1748249 RepID=A0ABR5SMD5_9BACT|nr:hypothetical protein [Candidatus Magnetominusculus xianensis]KWT92757.1 dihydroorotate dehydrogenase [Candidatus Magnetominusculus xianensis]MBF0405211.1 hypothetical protein [Nitrospirota bacterium]
MNRLFTADIVTNEQLDNRYFALQVTPNVAICETLAGQFFMLKSGEFGEYTDPLLLRPFSLASFIHPDDTYPNGLLMFLIDAVGKGTNILKRLPVGTRLNIIGPLGRGFPPVADDERLLIAAGGIGIASVLGLNKMYHGVPLFYGVRSRGQMIECTNSNIQVASDDGSIGDKGSVLALLERHISQLRQSYSGKIKIYACGPHGMYKAMFKMNLDADVYVALETPMACGVGTCLGCAVETTSGLQMVCKDGPVFNLKDIIWGG